MRLKRKQLALPYAIFLFLFVVLPLFVVVYYAFTNGKGEFTVENFLGFFENTKALGTLAYSLIIAVSTTVCCLLLAYPAAYILAKGEVKYKAVILILIVMPMWINFTLRITALKEILSFIEGNLAYHPFINTVLVMTYDFLPFMLLPIYNNLAKIDTQLIEASQDLGASHLCVFFRVVLPLSVPGIVSGVTMVLLPAMTNYVVLDMVYNSTYIMGSLIGSYFNSYDWNKGSMVSMILLLFIFVLAVFAERYSVDE